MARPLLLHDNASIRKSECCMLWSNSDIYSSAVVGSRLYAGSDSRVHCVADHYPHDFTIKLHEHLDTELDK